MLRKSLLSLAILAVFAGPSTVSAEEFEKFDTKVNGDIDIEVDVRDVYTRAYQGANAETDIGTINEGSWVRGDVDIAVKARDVKTIASPRANACTSMGTVGGGCVNDEQPFHARRRGRR